MRIDRKFHRKGAIEFTTKLILVAISLAVLFVLIGIFQRDALGNLVEKLMGILGLR